MVFRNQARFGADDIATITITYVPYPMIAKHVVLILSVILLASCDQLLNSPATDELLSDNDSTGACAEGFTGDQCASINYNQLPAAFRVQVTKGDQTRTFNLKKFDVRSSLSVKVVESDASVTTHTLSDPSRQYIGSVEEESNAIVSATLLPNGSLRYQVTHGDGSADWEMIPDEENDPTAKPNEYVVLTTPAKEFVAAPYPGATYVTPTKGGLTQDGKIYESHLDFVITKAYVDAFSSNVDTIIRKAETSVAQMTAHNLRDIMLDTRVSQILIRKDASPSKDTSRAQFDTYGMNNLSNNVFTIVTSGGGAAFGCRAGGDISNADEQTYTQDWASAYGDGTWYGVMRHEYGHALGAEHFPGNSPEGPTIMSGNALAKFSGDEIVNLEWCFSNKGVQNFKKTTPAAEFTAYEIPPVARLDKALELDSTNTVTIDVLRNDYDANGDKIAMKSFDAQSALGGTVTFVPATSSSTRDQLKYVAKTSTTAPDSCGQLCNSSDLLLWLDASDKNTLIATDGKTGSAITHLAALKTWTDKSSHGNDAVVYAAKSNPEVHLVGSQTIGALPTVKFSEDLMEIRALDIRQSTRPGITSIAVVYYDKNYDYHTLWMQRGYGDGSRRHDPTAGRTVYSISYDANGATEWTGMSNIYQSNPSTTSDGIGIALGSSPYPWDNYAGAYFSTLAVGELLIFNRKLSDIERQTVESYLAKKWSLSIQDQFKYSITDDTGRTSQGLVYVPVKYEAKTDLTALNGKTVYIRNRKECDVSTNLCNWHMSWFGDLSILTDVANTTDLVPWKLTLVPNTVNQFYITNTWGCPSHAKCNRTLQIANTGELSLIDTNNVVPFEISLVPGTDAPGKTKEYYIRSKYQCESGHFRCNGPVGFYTARHILVDFPYRDPVPWSIEIVP